MHNIIDSSLDYRHCGVFCFDDRCLLYHTDPLQSAGFSAGMRGVGHGNDAGLCPKLGYSQCRASPMAAGLERSLPVLFNLRAQLAKHGFQLRFRRECAAIHALHSHWVEGVFLFFVHFWGWVRLVLLK